MLCFLLLERFNIIYRSALTHPKRVYKIRTVRVQENIY